MPVQNETFTPKEFMSMCLKGNINRTGQRALQSFTLWKNIQIFPSEAKVCELGKGGVVPMTLKLKVGDKMFAVSYKPIDDLVLNAIHPMIVNNTILSFDLVVGADHGQGSMQCAVKIILCYIDNETKTIVKTC